MKNCGCSLAGPGLSEDLTAAMCVGSNHTFMMTVQRGDGGRYDTLGSVFLGTANQRLMLRASGCLEALTAAEVSLLAQRHPELLFPRFLSLLYFTYFTETSSIFEHSD